MWTLESTHCFRNSVNIGFQLPESLVDSLSLKACLDEDRGAWKKKKEKEKSQLKLLINVSSDSQCWQSVLHFSAFVSKQVKIHLCPNYEWQVRTCFLKFQILTGVKTCSWLCFYLSRAWVSLMSFSGTPVRNYYTGRELLLSTFSFTWTVKSKYHFIHLYFRNRWKWMF